MRLLPWLPAAVAVVLGGLWLASRRSDEGASFSPSVEPAPVPTPVSPSRPREAAIHDVDLEDADRTVRAAPQEPPGEPTLSALVRRLDAVRGTDEGSERRLLAEIVALGTEEARAAALEGLDHPVSALADRRAEAARLFAGVTGSRTVHRWAVRSLDERLAYGPAELGEIADYHRLVARNGGAAGAAVLLEHLHASSPELVASALSAVARLEDRSLASEFVRLLGDSAYEAIRPQLARALFTWEEPGLTEMLLDDAFDPGVDLELRCDLFAGLGPAGVDAAALERTVQLYTTLVAGGGGCLPEAVAGVWQRLGGETVRVSGDHLAQHLLPVVRAELTSGVDARIVRGARVVELVGALRLPETRELLEGLLSGTSGELPRNVRPHVEAAIGRWAGREAGR